MLPVGVQVVEPVVVMRNGEVRAGPCLCDVGAHVDLSEVY